ncbi:hypothetical protein MRS76_24895 [Rhizobiaceae bacterium n13]|uniref:DUF2188 domain-containing protein n=1 Tax=Ferirhizobium litorale TaxID=2927786 RepID=A0AAE3QBT3_9HYPH|nr:hypothetical protein [Fererhizobium litorale]MDI7865151.1 hypothetical protein [Fererhizobium litorale]MDI7922877.1 hypothetical protein [Fererhizobium litorale]
MGSMYRRQTNLPSGARFTIGQDHHGWWVVQDKLGRVGGLFTTEGAALHFAVEESNHNPADVCRAPEGVVVEPDPFSRTRSTGTGTRKRPIVSLFRS